MGYALASELLYKEINHIRLIKCGRRGGTCLLNYVLGTMLGVKIIRMSHLSLFATTVYEVIF